MSSMVMSVDHPGLTFNLTLMRSEPTYNQPVQQWVFTSDFAVSTVTLKACFFFCFFVETPEGDPHVSVPSAPHRCETTLGRTL